jgi:flagellar protein FlbD
LIKLTRLNNSEILLNTDLIEHVEIGANTVVMLTDGNSFVVQESAEELLERVIQFRKRIQEGKVPVIVERYSA